MAHSLRTHIMTPTGAVALVDIRPGDTILSAVGTTQIVESIVDEGLQELVLLTSSDNYSVEATEGQSIALFVDKEEDVTVKSALIAFRETQVVVPPITVPSVLEGDIKEIPILIHPFLLGLMLQEDNPLPGYVSLVPDPVDLYTKYLPVPEMVSAEGGTYRMVYSQDWLETVGVSELLEEANLFKGDPKKYRIPKKFLYSGKATRESLLRSFLPPTVALEDIITSEHLEAIPYNHPGIGEDLKFLTYSLGWVRMPLRTYSMVEHTWRYEEVRSMVLSNPEDGYLVSGYLPMRYLP